MEDVDEEEVGELVDPEDLRRGEVGDVVPAELQKVDTIVKLQIPSDRYTHIYKLEILAVMNVCGDFKKSIMLNFGVFPFLQPCVLHWETEQSGDDDSKDHPTYQIPGD